MENLSDLNNDPLMASYSNAKTLSTVGGVVTGTGIGLIIGGAAKELSAAVIILGGGSAPYKSGGGGLIISGAVLAIGGTITWISGGSRKKQMKPIIASRGLVSDISIYPGACHDLMTDIVYPAVTIRIGF